MFLLDTNAVSVVMDEPLPSILAEWLAGTPARFLYTAAVCQAEVLAGIAVLPEGRRRLGLEEAAHAVFEKDFAGKVLSFDSVAAEAYAEIFAGLWRGGRRADPPDLMIAAIALIHDFGIVTRNVRDFDGCGVAVINPWDE